MLTVDLLIAGAGPAGLSAAQYGARAGLKTLVIEAASIGGEMLNIDRLENYPGAGGEAPGAAPAGTTRPPPPQKKKTTA
jgi:thioredoxin reductase (NADPH)